jgi:hypothetical protein
MSAQSGLQQRFRDLTGTAYDWNGDMVAAAQLLTGIQAGAANEHLFRLCQDATGSTQPDLPGQLAAFATMFGATNWSSCGYDNWPPAWDSSGFILLQDGSHLLMQDGSGLLLEQ